MRYNNTKPTTPAIPNLGRGTECVKLPPKAENIMENISNATLKDIISYQQKACFQSQEALLPMGRSKASVGWKEKKYARV